MRCDLHVHSYYSGPCSSPRFLGPICRECYSNPEDVYAILKQRGMNIVTLTDHDSIEGCEALRRYPDFFVSEEITCTMPSGTKAHVGVYDITDRQHIEIQRRRDDLVALLMYLTEHRLFFCVNHVFSAVTGPRVEEDFEWFEEYFPAMETLNSLMPVSNNRQAVRLARRMRKIALGGSDAHTLASVGTAYTEVQAATTAEEFLSGVRQGFGKPRGKSGSYAKLTRDVLIIAREMMRERRWTAVMAPLALLVPAVIAANLFSERLFARRWAGRAIPKFSGRSRFPLFAMEASAVE
jgi:predicted metal-dependent phosphoesterase TrpH